MKKENSIRKINKRNYLILLLLAIVTVFLTIYICKWISIYKQEKLSSSPLKEHISQIYLEELKESISETNEAIIYVSYTKDESVYNLEEKMVREIERKGLQNNVFYVNVDDYLENEKYEQMLKEIFPELNDKKLVAPLLIYTKRANPIKIKVSGEEPFTIVDFNNLANILETE